MHLLYKYIIYAHCFSILYGLTGVYNGQLWSDTEVDSKLSNIGYIPTFSFEKNIIDNRYLDFEFSRKFIYDSNEKVFLNDNYRSWIRYSDNTLDARLGLQKISFGNSIILRPLNWFDSIDFRNITGQTDGLNALRLQFFPSLTQSIWLWCVDEIDISCGGRFEFFNKYGSFGVTYHNDQNNAEHEIFQVPQIIDNQPVFPGPGKNNRLGLDFRYDGNIGVWFDSSVILFDDTDDSSLRISTIGGDYTIPIYNGLLLMVETMNLSIESENELQLNQNTTAFMSSTPIGLLNDFMLISIIDWKSKDKFNFIRWSTTFDYLSLSWMFSVNPKPLEDSFKIMLIYNH
tara:strand:- start:331 stop:1359 length:1029 start_codon:yes stop_codon:yes gene_type:complete